MRKILIILSVIVMSAMPSSLTALTEPNPPVYKEGLEPKSYAYMVLGERQGELLSNIIQKESGWCHTKWNRQTDCPEIPREHKIPGGTSAYGLCQTMMSYHGDGLVPDFKTNPYAQVDWCIAYAIERYGTLDKAWQFWKQNKHW